MHRDRLTRMAALLRRPLPEDYGFDLRYWQASADPLDFPDCGTTCCAVGLATLDPWFDSQGLRMSALERSPRFGAAFGFDAAAAFFEISDEAALALFGEDHYPRSEHVDHDRACPFSLATPEMVAQKIDALLDGATIAELETMFRPGPPASP